jgi:hypothetical protein
MLWHLERIHFPQKNGQGQMTGDGQSQNPVASVYFETVHAYVFDPYAVDNILYLIPTQRIIGCSEVNYIKWRSIRGLEGTELGKDGFHCPRHA